MGSQYTALDVGFPSTLVTDVSPSQLQANESPDLRNIVASEPGHVRPRRGWKRSVQYFSNMADPRNSVLTGVQQIGQRVAISYNIFTGGQIRDEWLPRYHYTRDVAGLDINEGASRVIVIDAGAPNGTSWTTNGEYTESTTGATGAAYGGKMNAVVGRTVNYNGFSYGCTTRAVWRRTRETNETSQAASLGEALVRWSGLNPTTMNYSVLATATNGLTSVTLASDPTAGGSLVGSIMRIGTGSAITPAESPRATGWFTYRVAAHSGTSVTLDRPYGLGEPTTLVPTLTNETVTFTAEADVANAPLGVQCVEVYKDRIFTGRANMSPAVGGFGGYYANMINWSEPGEPEKWPAQNFIIVDDEFDDPIMGLASVAGQLLIFKRHKSYVLTGTDESSFAVDKFSGSIGCIFSGSIAMVEEKVVWAGENGIYSYDGETLDEITQPEPGRGIKKAYVNRMRRDNENNDKHYTRWPRIHVNKDHLMVSLADTRHELNDNSYVYNHRTKSWSEFGRRFADGDANVVLTAPDLMFKGWVAQNGVSYGLLDWQMVNVNKCFSFEQEGIMAATAVELNDEFYNSNASTTSVPVVARMQFPDLRLGDGDTVRVKEVQVEHDCYYVFNTDLGPALNAWNLTIAEDSRFTNTLTYPVTPRCQVYAGYPTNVELLNDAFYMDRYPDIVSLEGGMFRLILATDLAYTTVQARKLFKVRLLLEPSKTRLNRNQ